MNWITEYALWFLLAAMIWLATDLIILFIQKYIDKRKAESKNETENRKT